MKQFPNQNFIVSHGKLFCTACKEEVALKRSVIELHIKSEKHERGKVKMASNEKREQDIVKAQGVYDQEVHPVGENLPTDQRVYQVACKVALVQPSSSAAERVFSLLTNSFGVQQDLALQDYIECSIMLQYN